MKRILVIGLFFFLFFSSAWGWADDYMFVTLEFPPLEYTEKDGKVQGAAVEAVTQIIKNLGHTLEIMRKYGIKI